MSRLRLLPVDEDELERLQQEASRRYWTVIRSVADEIWLRSGGHPKLNGDGWTFQGVKR
jgi:hypothetical protein